MRFLALGILVAAFLRGEISSVMVGHELRQDDMPALAAAPDGSLWAAWLSWDGSKDDIGIRHYSEGRWGNLQWVPNTSGDSWAPQVGVDAQNRVWVVWSQMAGANWDLYARRFDPAKQEWGRMERLTTDAGPDVNPRVASDGKGRIAVVWQGWRGKNSNIFLKTLEGEKWSADMRITSRAANDWEPSAAIGPGGEVWVAYDSYKNGNYDVFLKKAGTSDEIPVATSARFEARASVAVDSAGRVWVAWEAGNAGWGKDQGYILRQNPRGVPLGGVREPRVRVYENGQWKDPAATLVSAFPQGANTYQPNVFSDGKGSVWVVAKTRSNMFVAIPGAAAKKGKAGAPGANRGYWQYRLTHYDGSKWAAAEDLSNNKGRSSTRMGGAVAGDGSFWMVWDTDGRTEKFYHRPLRQMIYAGKAAAARATSLQWGTAPADAVNAPAGHANEAADLRAIRGYSVTIGGKANRIVRGDFHRHTELSWDGGGTQDGSLQDFYRYMIDAASMDFGASTDHQGGAWPYWWWYTQKMTDMYHVPGTYVPIFGYERSAVFPNGHRNMFFARRTEARVTPFHLREGVEPFALGKTIMGDEPGIGSGDLVANDTKLLYEEIRKLNGIAISHTSGTRMGTDWRDNDPILEPVVEIFQGARTNYEQLGFPYVVKEGVDDQHMATAGYQPEGMVANAWTKGYKLGIITSSDHGSTHISYAMVYTDQYSRQGVLDGIRRRHTYGATDNIILDVRMGEHFMGDEFALAAQEPIKVKARGARAVAKVDIIRDNKVIYTTEPKKQDVAFEFTDKADAKGRHFYYVRLMQEDGMIAWSSPFFINYGK